VDVIVQAIVAKPWLMLGLLLGLVIRTVGPWLMKRPRPAFDWRFMWDTVCAGALTLTPAIIALPALGAAWGDVVLGAAVTFGAQGAVREFITKWFTRIERRKS